MFQYLERNQYPTDLWNCAIFVVQLFRVQRAGEVLSLQSKDIRTERGSVQIRVSASKTYLRKQGIFFKMPRESCFGFNLTEILTRYILSLEQALTYIFPTYNKDSKKFENGQMTVDAWKQAIKRICQCSQVHTRTLYAL